jgi:hypothetical protein
VNWRVVVSEVRIGGFFEDGENGNEGSVDVGCESHRITPVEKAMREVVPTRIPQNGAVRCQLWITLWRTYLSHSWTVFRRLLSQIWRLIVWTILSMCALAYWSPVAFPTIFDVDF